MKFNKEVLRRDLITKRYIDKVISMDIAAKEIGISKATLSRAENNKTIDIDTFVKICNWLKTEPQNYIY